MKLDEILEQEQLDEASKRAGIAAGVLGATAGMWGAAHVQDMLSSPTHSGKPAVVQQQQKKGPELAEVIPTAKRLDHKQVIQAARIQKRYSVDMDLAKRIVELAHQYEKPVFPKAQDILSIIGVESSFNPQAVSHLKKDPAVGLMQVRPRVWNMDPDDLNDIEAQISKGADILGMYYKKLHDREAAVQAYNVGLTDFNQGVSAPEYLQKFYNARQLYAGI